MSLQDLWAEARQFSEHSSIEDHLAALEMSASSRTKLEDAPLPFSLDELAQLAEKQLKPVSFDTSPLPPIFTNKTTQGHCTTRLGSSSSMPSTSRRQEG